MSLLCRVEGLRVEHRRPLSFAPAVVAVRGASLVIEAGERVGLVGPSGCGKTSLLRAICGLAPRAAGSVSLLGLDPRIAGRPPRGVQLLLQDAGASLNPGLRVQEWLAESARVHGHRSPEAVASVLSRYGLGHRAQAFPAMLSGGEQRRVTLAALALASPRLVFADEPTAGLDASRKADALKLLLEHAGPDQGLVLVTHDLLLARHACTRLVFMDAGEVVADAPVNALSRIAHAGARALLRSAHLLPDATP
jgi:peptide/nickel transport system ATP-binding protein